MESLLKILSDNASFVYDYGNFVLAGLLILVLSADLVLGRMKSQTLVVKITRWIVVLMVVGLSALIYMINIPLKPMIETLASVEEVIGKEIEDTSFLDVQTGEISQLSAIDSEYIIINIWATFCPPCVRELPDLMKVENAYKDQLTVVALSNEDPERIRQFLSHREVPSIVGSTIDKDWINPDEFLPVSIFIHNGVVVEKHFGRLTYEEIERICFGE